MNGNNIGFIPITVTLGKIILFFMIAGGIGFILNRIFQWLELSNENNDKIPTFSLAMALIFAFIAEKLGVSGIIGAYIAGLIIGNTKKGSIIKPKIELLVSLIFLPIFSANLGLKLETLSFSGSAWIFIIVFAIIAILGKLIGNGIGAKMCNYSKDDAISIGMGMAIRGELALIMLDKGLELQIISSEIFSMMLVAIAIITFITPIILQIRLRRKELA